MPATDQLIKCPNCRAVLGPGSFGGPEFRLCPSCQNPLQIEIFPALFREPQIVLPEIVSLEGESTCFYHLEKKAVVFCEVCGRFLCALCDVELDGKHICPSCLATGAQKGRLRNLQTRHVCHEKIGLALAIFPLLFVFPTLITAPIAIFWSIKHWKSPPGIVHRRKKLMFGCAIGIALLELAGWATVLVIWLTR